MTMLTAPRDRVAGERVICHYRKERSAVLFHLTSGHRGLRRIIEGLPAEAIIDKPWRIKESIK